MFLRHMLFSTTKKLKTLRRHNLISLPEFSEEIKSDWFSRLKKKVSCRFENLPETDLPQKKSNCFTQRVEIEIPKEINFSLEKIEKSTLLNFKTLRGSLHYHVPKKYQVLWKKRDNSEKIQISCVNALESLGFQKCLREIHQLLIGVTQGYKKKLKIVGVGYKALLENNSLKVDLGFSHAKYYSLPPTVQPKFGRKNKRLHIIGTSLPLVAETAASLHSFKKPDVYKGKGIRYRGVKLIRKEGKKKK